MNGISLGEEEKKMGLNSSSTRLVYFEDVKVPIENMISKRGAGFKIAMNALNVGRIKMAAASLTNMKYAITYSTLYANERQ